MSLFGKNQPKDVPPEKQPPAEPAPSGRPLSAPRSQADALEPKPQPGRAFSASHGGGANMAHIGKSIAIKGDLTGDEDLEVIGTVEGRIDLPNNELLVGSEGKVRAEVHAKTVVVEGRVTGNVTAVERVELRASGVVEGDVRTPRLVVQEGAVLNGSVEMGETKGKSIPTPSPAPTPAPAPKMAAGGDGS